MLTAFFCEDSDDEIFHEAQIFNELALIKKQDTPVQQVISLMMAHDLYCALSTRRLSTSLPECQPYYVPRAPSYLYTYCKRVALSIQNVAYIRLNALAHTTELAVRLFRQLSLTAAPNPNFLLPSGTLKAENFDRGSAEHIIDHSAAWFRSSQNKWFRNSDRLSVVGYYGYLNPSRIDRR
ncbi:hypothetical protein FRC02_009476 [Tulasnella sp. 418]|nr:hypothetical protein FRC02_009476 [Tulasnella sp. 418]